jgi:hypothetical protein
VRLLALALLVGCEGVDPPVIASVTPASAPRGETVELAGERFCELADDSCAPFSGSVAFGLELPQIRAVPVSWAPQRIRLVVPQNVADGATVIVVTVDGRTSNAVEFTVAP